MSRILLETLRHERFFEATASEVIHRVTQLREELVRNTYYIRHYVNAMVQLTFAINVIEVYDMYTTADPIIGTIEI